MSNTSYLWYVLFVSLLTPRGLNLTPTVHATVYEYLEQGTVTEGLSVVSQTTYLLLPYEPTPEREKERHLSL